MTSEKAKAFEQKKRQHVTDIAQRFLANFKNNPLASIRPYTELERPVNFSTAKEYRGQNVFTLNWAKRDKGFKWNSWVTFNQAKALDAGVRKGEKSTAIIGAISGVEGENQVDRELSSKRQVDFEVDKQGFVGFNLFNVFNVEQVEGLSLTDVAHPGANPFVRSVLDLDNDIKSSPYEIVFGYSDISFDRAERIIQYPSRASFGVSDTGQNSSEFYSGIVTLVQLSRILDASGEEMGKGNSPEAFLAALIIAACKLQSASLSMSRSTLPEWLIEGIVSDSLNLSRVLRIVDTSLE